jgi:AhpD family alkylhydroperoxidase
MTSIKLEKKDREMIQHIINDITETYRFYSKNLKSFGSYFNFTQKAFSKGKISEKYKHLIVIGMALLADCQPCMAFHTGECLRSGGTIEEILEVIELAIEMGGGPISVKSSYLLKVLEFFKEKYKLN